MLVALIPVVFISFHLYQAAWDNAWREINEKHRLLALNLANPITIYIEDHRNMLGKLAQDVAQSPTDSAAIQEKKLRDALLFMDGFQSLALIYNDGKSITVDSDDQLQIGIGKVLYHDDRCFQSTLQTKVWCLSDIKHSILNQQPTITMTQALPTHKERASAVLVAELRIDLIEKLRKNIKFGIKGHSAIVDSRGHVIAHPNPQWMQSIHDLSALPIVQKMMRGETGVTRFYSPFVKKDMVAGYTSVPNIGWGIMVPQPLEEVELQVESLMKSHTRWLFLGFALAILIGVILVRWITRPLNRLVNTTDTLLSSNFSAELPAISSYAPRETQKLYQALQTLITGFRHSQQENQKLNRQLQERVDDTTAKLLESNARLERLALCDHLTTLPNRRQFENALRNQLSDKQSAPAPICLMLIDIDNLKTINDCYGHAAGDIVIRDIAHILNNAMRLGDLVARYGGDEFAAQLQCNENICQTRAEQIRQQIENTGFEWQGKSLSATASIGILYCQQKGNCSIDDLLHKVDTTMYQAKKLGRNQVHHIQLD